MSFRNGIKNYESLEETERIDNIYGTQYGSNLDKESETKNKLVKNGIIILVILVSIFFIFRIFHKKKSDPLHSNQLLINQQKQQTITKNITQQLNEKKNENSNLKNKNNLISKDIKSLSSNLIINNEIKDNNNYTTYNNYYNYNYTYNNNFSEIFPKIDEQNRNIKKINDLFRSRRLYINSNNLTNEYINYLRPINETGEGKYKQILYNNLTFFKYLKYSKEGQLSPKEYYQMCNSQKLIEVNTSQPTENPEISIIIPSYNKNGTIMTAINSVVRQTFKNIEIIIVDDCSTDKSHKIYEYLLENEPRIRLFKHKINMGAWRSRLDGFLYSKGKYILQIDPDDILADCYILEDIYNLVTQYNLDSVRFTFSKVPYSKDFINNPKFGIKHNYPKRFLKIIYGSPGYNVHYFGYGTIWNRLTRANVITKGLNLVDEYILNAYKNLWDDMWMNDLIDRTSFSNLIVNRLGYIFISSRNGESRPKIKTRYQRDKTIKEFIYFWLFDYQLLPKNSTKKKVIKKLINYNKKDYTFYGLPMRLDYLNSYFYIYERLLNLIINDSYVEPGDKKYVEYLLKNSTKNKT